MNVKIQVNGVEHQVEVDQRMPLLWVLRDLLGLRGTKYGCGTGLCGACTVHLDGVATRSCITAVSAVGEAPVVTIEGIGRTSSGRALQAAWLETEVMQCGYCQAGQIMSAAALLSRFDHPSDEQIDAAMVGNICRCGTYGRIRQAIKAASGARAGRSIEA